MRHAASENGAVVSTSWASECNRSCVGTGSEVERDGASKVQTDYTEPREWTSSVVTNGTGRHKQSVQLQSPVSKV